MKRFQKLSGLFIAASIVLSMFSGCTSGDDSGSAATNTATEAATSTATEAVTEAATEAVAGIEGWTAFDSNVNITVPVYDRSKEGYPAVDDNYWTQWVQSEFGDTYNVTVEYVAIPRTDVMTKYALLIAGGDTPTIMMEYDYPKVAQWASEGAMQVISIDDFKQVAPNYYQSMVDNNQLGYTDINGETYFILSERPYYNTTYTYATFVRMDWLRAVGYDEVPQNYAEKLAAIAAIVDAGLCGDYPIGFTLPTDAYARNYGFRDYPVDETEWAMHSSLATSSLSWEPTYNMLKRTNAEYNSGWYSTEFEVEVADVSGATSQMETDFVNGRVYEYGGYMSASVSWLTAFYENNPDAELALASNYTPVEPGVMDQPQIRADNPFGMIVGFSSFADSDQLKAAWMLMEWMSQDEVLYTMENGVEGVTYNLDANGNPVMVADYSGEVMLNHNNNIDMTCLVHASKNIGTIEESIAAISPSGLPQDFTQALTDNYYELREIADNGWAYSDPVFAVAVDSESEYSATLLSLWKEYYVQLVKCSPDEFDGIYAQLSQQYLDAGYQEILDERLTAYEAGNTTKLPK